MNFFRVLKILSHQYWTLIYIFGTYLAHKITIPSKRSPKTGSYALKRDLPHSIKLIKYGIILFTVIQSVDASCINAETVSTGSAYLTTEALIHICSDSSDDENVGMCAGYILGVRDSIVREEMVKENPRCPIKRFHIYANDLVDVITKQKYPDQFNRFAKSAYSAISSYLISRCHKERKK